MSAPVIPTLPEAPSPSDSREAFNSKAFPFVQALGPFGDAINAFGDYLGDVGDIGEDDLQVGIGNVLDRSHGFVTVFNGGALLRDSAGRALGLTIPIGSTGISSYIQPRLTINSADSQLLLGSRILVDMEFDVSAAFDRTVSFAIAVRHTVSTIVNLSTAVTRSEKVGGKLYVSGYADVTTASDQPIRVIEPFVQVTAGASVSGSNQTILLVDESISILSNTESDIGSNKKTGQFMESQLNRKIGISPNMLSVSDSLSVGLNNAVIENDWKIVIPYGVTGQSSYLLPLYRFEGSKFAGARLRLTMAFTTSATFTRTYTVNCQSLSGSGSTSTMGRLNETTSIPSAQRNIVSFEVTIAGTEIGLRPFIQLSTVSSTASEESIQLTDFYIEVVSAPSDVFDVGDLQLLLNQYGNRLYNARRANSLAQFGHERAKHDVTLVVDAEGLGDFTSPRLANASVFDASAANRYKIDIMPGAYNADLDWFSRSHVDLIARDSRSTILNYDNLDSRLPGALRNDQTIWVNSTTRLEGLKISGSNLRYAVHIDGGGAGTAIDTVQTFIDCVIEHKGNDGARAYQSSIAATFTGSVATTGGTYATLTVTSISSGSIAISGYLTGAGVPDNMYIQSQLTGTLGGVGTYEVSPNTAVAGPGLGLIGKPSEVWGAEFPMGVGTESGQMIYCKGCTFTGPRGGWYHHTREYFKDASVVTLENCRLLPTDPTLGKAVTLVPFGSRRADRFHITDSQIGGGLIAYNIEQWRATGYEDLVADQAEILVTGHGNSPSYTVVDSNGARALRIDSLSTGVSSTVEVSGTAAEIIFGEVTTLDGDVGLSGCAYGKWDIGARAADGTNYLTSLGVRLGDCTSANKTLTVVVDGGSPINVVFNLNYTPATNQSANQTSNNTVIAAINAALTGVAVASEFDITATYRPFFSDEELSLKNTSSTTILKGRVLAIDTTEDNPLESVRLMTSADAATLFAGVAMENIRPGKIGRVKTSGWLASTDVSRSDAVALSYGDTFSVGVTDGVVAVGGSQGLLLAVKPGVVQVKAK